MTLQSETDSIDSQRAKEFAREQGYITEEKVGGLSCETVQWPFTDRDRALLSLVGFPLTNHRGFVTRIANSHS